MIECQECDEGQIQKIQTPYGCKEVCDACDHVAKDVDTYAGVMVWSHKTAPEIEIHASKASAAAVLDSNRSRVVRNPVRVAHHAPQEMGGRRQNTGRVKDEEHKCLARPAKERKALKQRSVEIPKGLAPHVQPMIKADSAKLRTFTRFTSEEVKTVIAALPHTASMDELCCELGLRAGKHKKPTGILSWLSAFGHAEPPKVVTVWEDADCLVLKSESCFSSHASRSSLDSETLRALGYKSGASRYNRI